jgi:hypothetical protein
MPSIIIDGKTYNQRRKIMANDKIKLGEYWRYYRGGENNLRHWGDFMIALMQIVPGGRDYEIGHLDPAKLAKIRGAYPNMCVPPGPCFRTLPEMLQILEDLRDRADIMFEFAQTFISQLANLDIDQVEYWPTELPGAGREWKPHGTTP